MALSCLILWLTWSLIKLPMVLTFVRANSVRFQKGQLFGFKTTSDAFQFTGAARPGTISPRLIVPNHIMKPDYAGDGVPVLRKAGSPWEIISQTSDDVQRMRVAGRIAREVLDTAIQMIRPGITTNDIDEVVHFETIKRHSYPSPLNYHGFPKSVCTSVNEIICHGIPDSTELKNGDIINVDVTIFHDGVHGDCSETVFVGEVSDAARDLVVTTHQALNAAIAICKPGRRYNELGGVIEDIIAPKGYRSCKVFCGHGIGRIFHTYPNVLHYRNSENSGVMAVGHTFTIEPMVCAGSSKAVTWPDLWTAATEDGSLTAQFEHTLLVTEDGVEVLTGKLPSSQKYCWEEA